MSSSGWDTIESDPSVFNEMLEVLGVRGVQMEELLDLDAPSVSAKAPLALFFLFKYERQALARADAGSSAAAAAAAPGVAAATAAAAAAGPPVFFARQTVQNACGTLALLHALLNLPRGGDGGGVGGGDIELGAALTQLAAFAADLPPELRGDLLAASDEIRAAHNRFARPEPFAAEEDGGRRRRRAADVFHFVAYTRVGALAYELDGLRAAPLPLGAPLAAGEDWLAARALPEIVRRIEAYAAGEVHFNVLALVRDKLRAAAAALAAAARRLEARHAAAERLRPGALAALPAPAAVVAELAAAVPEFAAAAAAAAAAAGAGDAAGEEDGRGAEPAAAYAAELSEIEALRMRYRDEVEAREAGRIENVRRRHNFIPLLMELARQLARKAALTPLLQAARVKLAAARERARAAGHEGE